MPWNKETAKEAAAKSLEVRRRRREMTPEERVEESCKRVAPQLINELIDAAKGTGDFTSLDLNRRIDAMKTVLAYGVGRPWSGKPNPKLPPDDEEEPPEVAALV